MNGKVWNEAEPSLPVFIIKLFVEIGMETYHTKTKAKEMRETVIVMDLFNHWWVPAYRNALEEIVPSPAICTTREVRWSCKCTAEED